jgi:hypothetical protein
MRLLSRRRGPRSPSLFGGGSGLAPADEIFARTWGLAEPDTTGYGALRGQVPSLWEDERRRKWRPFIFVLTPQLDEVITWVLSTWAAFVRWALSL